METEKECGDCGFTIPDDQVVSHLQTYHVGPRHFESIVINCGECALALPLSDPSLRLMIRHCHVTGHSPQELMTEWQQFMENENRRLSRLLQLGVRIEAGGVTNDVVDEESPMRKRKQVAKQESVKKSSKHRPKIDNQKSELGALFLNDQEENSPLPTADIPIQYQTMEPMKKEESSIEPSKKRRKEKPKKPFNKMDAIFNEVIGKCDDSNDNGSCISKEPEKSKKSISGTKEKKTKKTKPIVKSDMVINSSVFVHPKSETGESYPQRIAEQEGSEEDLTEEETFREMFSNDLTENTILHPAEGHLTGNQNRSDEDHEEFSEKHQVSASPRDGEADSEVSTYSCSLCEFQAQRRDVRRRPKMLLHTLSHDKSLYPFKCLTCPYRAPTVSVFQSHKKSKASLATGCDGGYENVQSPESIQKLRELLARGFPEVNWAEAIPPGTILGGTKL